MRLLVPRYLTALAALWLMFGAYADAQTEAPVYGYTFVPPDPSTSTPRILKVELNSDVLRAGGPIEIRVSTTPDVVTVVTGNGKHQGTIPQSAPGVFTTGSTLPHLGGLAAIPIKLHFKATTAAGASTEIDVPVKYK